MEPIDPKEQETRKIVEQVFALCGLSISDEIWEHRFGYEAKALTIAGLVYKEVRGYPATIDEAIHVAAELMFAFTYMFAGTTKQKVTEAQLDMIRDGVKGKVN